MPHAAQRVHEVLGGSGDFTRMSQIKEVSEAGNADYPVLTGDYDTGVTWGPRPISAGVPLAAPTPVFTKLDPSIVDEELARLEQA